MYKIKRRSSKLSPVHSLPDQPQRHLGAAKSQLGAAKSHLGAVESPLGVAKRHLDRLGSQLGAAKPQLGHFW